MDTRRLLAYLLLALGAVALLARISGGSGWLWVGVVAAAFLVAWRREGTYGLLAIGSILAGVSLGMLLEGNLGWDGAFLVGLGLGILGIDLAHPRPHRLPRIVGAIVVVAGLGLGIVQAGVLGSTWFGVLLILAGLWLVRRRDGGWVYVGPPPGSESTDLYAPQPPAGPPEDSDATPTEEVDEPGSGRPR